MADDYPLAPGEAYLSPEAGDIASYRDVHRQAADQPASQRLRPARECRHRVRAGGDAGAVRHHAVMQPKVSTGGGKSRDDIVGDTAIALAERNFKVYDLDAMAKSTRSTTTSA